MFVFLMIRRPPRSTLDRSSAASDVYKRQGYTFDHWNTAANDSGTDYADGATFPFTADQTLFAQWSALPTQTVTFDNNGGSGSMANQVANVPTALDANTFTRAGYTLSLIHI